MNFKIVIAFFGAGLLAGFVASAQVQTKWALEWTDHPANPVDLKSPGSRAYMPYVLYRPEWPAESRYRVWYDSESISGIAYASSPDGLQWSAGVEITGIHTAEDSSTGGEFAGRPVVLYNPGWEKPYRLYYYGRTDTSAHPIWVAESADGIAFENHQMALDPSLEGSRLGTFPDGHAVIHLPGRTLDPEDPSAERPFLMFFRSKDGQGIAYAESADGYTFTEPFDDPETSDTIEGLVEIRSADDEWIILPAHPTQILQLAQNDLRMLAFEQNTSLKYLVSANGLFWRVTEDPIPGVGELGPEGAWNDQRNYHASMAYVGAGKFLLLRGGRDNESGLYRTGAAFGFSAFYEANDFGVWSFLSPFDDFEAEGWVPFTTTGNDPDGNLIGLFQNADGTVSVRDRQESGNFYMRRNAAWVVPFTFEFRARLDDAVGVGTDEEFPKFTVAAFQTDLDHPGGEAWQPAFAQTRFGGWNLPVDPSAEADLSQFQTFTVVARFDEAARAQLAVNPGNGQANVNLCVFDVYLNRDFSAPRVTFHNTGFNGWDSVDYLGALDIGFPGPSAGQVTLDWVRWGNGVILDPTDPGDSPAVPQLSITLSGNSVIVAWTGDTGVLESSASLAGSWTEVGSANPATIAADGEARFFRVRY